MLIASLSPPLNAVCDELKKTGDFEFMSSRTDEDEHSIEMHLPYIFKVMESRKDSYTVVPILVGALSTTKEAHYGKLLAPYLADPRNLFVISSDFCHWGSRFSFTSRHCSSTKETPIYKSIEALDRDGMELIEKGDVQGFAEYLKTTRNTICGRCVCRDGGKLLCFLTELFAKASNRRAAECHQRDGRPAKASNQVCAICSVESSLDGTGQFGILRVGGYLPRRRMIEAGY